MSQGNSHSGKFNDRSFTLLVGLFSLGLLALGLVVNWKELYSAVSKSGGIPFGLGFTLVGVLGVLVHSALRAQQKKIQALEGELAQIRLQRMD